MTIVMIAVTMLSAQASGAEVPDVLVIRLHGEVTSATASYLQRELDRAEDMGIPVIIDIDTFGGLAKAAFDISEILLGAEVETTAYVSGKAISAGVILTMSCDHVAMVPNAYIGATEPVPYSEKSLSVVKGTLQTVAENKGRPVDVILAMADKRDIVEGYSTEGELLTLSASQALELGISDVTADDLDDVMVAFQLGTDYVFAEFTTADRFARFLTSSTVLSILLTLGFMLIIVEIYTAGFGVAGFGAIVCFALYFFGGALAGTTEWWSIVLFVAGAVFLGIEMVIPGFGVFGITGIIMALLGIVFSAKSLSHGVLLVGIGVVASGIMIPIFGKIFGRSKLFDRLVNSEQQTQAEGYTAANDESPLLGAVGTVINPLHPAGIVKIDGQRIDVVSYGTFIDVGKQVRVVEVKGSRIIVDLLEE